jgi:hypothetical protein
MSRQTARPEKCENVPADPVPMKMSLANASTGNATGDARTRTAITGAKDLRRDFLKGC